MDWIGWKRWIDKKVFLRTKSGKVYSGLVIDVSETEKDFYFLALRDKFGLFVTLAVREIVEIKEEGDGRSKS